MCQQKSRHRELKALTHQVLAAHPQWQDAAVSYREGQTQHLTSFTGLKMQFDYFDKTCR